MCQGAMPQGMKHEHDERIKNPVDEFILQKSMWEKMLWAKQMKKCV